MSRLFLLFAIVPFIELYVLIQVGNELGLFTTLGLVILTAITGAWLARSQGVEVLARIQEEMAQGQAPTNSLLDGACILFAGMLLLTPGFVTDGVGLLLLFPPTRMTIRGWLGKNMATTYASHSHGGKGFHFGGAHSGHADQRTYDTTFRHAGEQDSYNADTDAYTGGSDTTVYASQQSRTAQAGPFGNGMRVVMHTMTVGPDGQRVSNTRTFQNGQSFGAAFDMGSNVEDDGAGQRDSGPRKAVIIESKPLDVQEK